jgi:hypothetical protein
MALSPKLGVSCPNVGPLLKSGGFSFGGYGMRMESVRRAYGMRMVGGEALEFWAGLPHLA